MGSIEKGFVHYCCVSKGGKILQSYNDNDNDNDNVNDSDNSGVCLEIEKLGALCLENVPQYHKWYSQSVNKRTYCYLIEDGFVYFAIAQEGLGNQALIRFLEHYRDEFKKVAKRGSNLRLSWKGKGKGSMSSSNLNSNNLQEQLVPVIRQLITSLQNVGQSSNGNGLNPSPSPSGGGCREVAECGSSTKDPLLGIKSGKQEKRGNKDHVIGMRGIELENQRKSTERVGLRIDTGSMEEMNASRRRPSSQTIRRKWCLWVRLVLAIDAVVCIVLFMVWLVICKGFDCIR